MKHLYPLAARATRHTSREINRQIVLDLLRRRSAVSRAELARSIGMQRSAIGSLVNDLIAEGLVREGAAGETARGRKPTLLFLDSQGRCVVAVDIRATRTFLVLTDMTGRELSPVESFPTDRRPAVLVRRLAARVRRTLASRPEAGTCHGVGVAVPGMLDRSGGVVVRFPALGWREVPLREALRAALELPVLMENAAKACALAQLWTSREARPPRDLVYVSVSDGVGVGVVVGGEVLRGQHNVAGEYGHLPLSLDGPPCACGSRGCWEAYVSNLATISRYVGRPFPPSQPIPRELASMNVLDVVGQARAGDTRALTALGTTGRYLGLGLAMIVKSLDPGRICIGGEITAAWDLIEPAVREGLAERGLIAADTEIVMVPSDEHLRLKGASALVGRPPTRVLPSLGRRPPPARPIPSGSGRRRAHASPRAARVDSGQRNAHRLGRPRPGARFRSAHVRRASLHGEIVLAKGYGVRQLGQRDSVDADTRFMIASNTKPLTTLMLAKLVDAGKFNWDTPVTEVMPTFTLASAQATKELRMRHLVCACTGLPRQDMEWIFEGERLTPASVLELVATMEPNSPIGALYQYSNLMAGAAGYIGGQVQHPGVETGAAYDAAMQELVFGPLGMGSTTFDVSAALRGNHARPHALDLDGHMVEVDLDVLSVDQLSRPDGGAWSTVNDLLRYLRMELDYGRLPDGSRYIGTAPLLARASAASLPGATGWVMASGSRSTQAPAPRCCTTGVRRRASSRTWSGGPNTTSAQSS